MSTTYYADDETLMLDDLFDDIAADEKQNTPKTSAEIIDYDYATDTITIKISTIYTLKMPEKVLK